MSARQREAEKKRRTQRVVIGYLHPGQVSGEFMDSLCRTMMREANERGLMGPGGGYISVRSGPRIAEGRSQLVESFLNAEIYKGSDWLLMVDSDMVFEPDTVRRMLSVANEETHPIVGALCFAGSDTHNLYPTVYALVKHEETWATEVVKDYPRNAIVKVGATGAAFLLVHRNVLRQMYEAFKVLPNGKPNNYPWFVEGHVDHLGRALGEDIAFCIRAQALGIPIHIHTGIKVGHHKSVILTEELWEEQRERSA